MIKIIETIEVMQALRERYPDKSIGFVPTMGNLHEAHLALVKRSSEQNDITVVSIFVNPIQFDNPDDLAKYPRTFEADLQKLADYEVDYVFAPQESDLYPDDARYRIQESTHEQHGCGRARPGHLSGSMTVVMKLLNIVQATRAYFGEKDYQQWQLVKGMVEAFFMPVEIVSVPLIRESTGLAMSSRNNRLSVDERMHAAEFYRILNEKQPIDATRNALEQEGFKVDYIEDLDNRRLAAVFLGDVRLIDNIEI